MIFGSFHQGKEQEKSMTALSIFNSTIYNLLNLCPIKITQILELTTLTSMLPPNLPIAYLSFTTFPFFALFAAASNISITTILFSKEVKS